MPEPETIPPLLIVDDDQGLLRLLEKTLTREGFRTATAASGREAIDWLTSHRASLMLLDLKLRDLEGKELIEHLASISCSVPFIIITGQGDERMAVEMMKRGALDYLVKDVQFIEFVPTVVRRALARLEKDRTLASVQGALEESRKEVLTISERERHRFGAELHDGLGQQLTAIELMCQALKVDLPPDRPDLAEQTAQICRFLREAIAHTRSLARGLSPVQLGGRGLAEALQELALRMSEAARLECAFVAPAPISIQDPLVAGHLFRIAQEAVTNAVKHAQASRVLVRLTRNSSGLRLEISDNGLGLQPDPRGDQGIGLRMMKHRASVLGGELVFHSQPGRGLTVRCTLPIKPP